MSKMALQDPSTGSNPISLTQNDFLDKKLRKLYHRNFIRLSKKVAKFLKSEKNTVSNWSNYLEKKDSKLIFDIPIELDQENPDPKKMLQSIIKYWRNDIFAKTFEPIIYELLLLGISNKFKENIDLEVSDKVYEMF